MRDINCNGTIQVQPSLGNAAWRAVRVLASLSTEKVSSGFAVLCEWQRRAEMRGKMARMEDRMLDDIGLSREHVDAEAQKPFWQD